MDENEITQRLRDAGDQPVPGELRASHLTQMHAATAAVHQPKRFGRLAVAAAAFVGFAVGSTGFAMAGALPDPAQQVAHDVLAVVQVDVENPRNRGQCISQAAKANPDDEAAKADAKAECPKGKPDHAGQGNGKAKGRPDGVGPTEGHPNDDTTDCKGKPPWAGKDGAPYPADQKAEFNRNCGRDVDDEPEELEVETEETAPAPQDEAEGLDGQAPGAEQRQADPQGDAPAEAPAGPPADGAPEQQDEGTTPPVETPAADETETETETG